VSSKYQSKPFIAPTKYTVSVNTNIKGASATCFGTSVHLQGGPNAILQDELLLGKLLFINSLADGGSLLIRAFQRHFVFKTGIFAP
jgi:hypothetical protein